MSADIIRVIFCLIVVQFQLFCCWVDAYPTPCPPSTRRYPIGYDPDNRTRPQWEHAISDTNPTLLPPPKRDFERWQPPSAYNPRLRKKNLSKHRQQLKRTDRPDYLETINFENMDDMDGKIKLCTGIWMGRKILQKRCVCLDTDCVCHQSI
jgi:hypothetical protein